MSTLIVSYDVNGADKAADQRRSKIDAEFDASKSKRVFKKLGTTTYAVHGESAKALYDILSAHLDMRKDNLVVVPANFAGAEADGPLAKDVETWSLERLWTKNLG